MVSERQSPTVTVEVPLQDRGYRIRICERLATALESSGDDLSDLSHALVIADQAVGDWSGALVDQLSKRSTSDRPVRVDVIQVPSGEPSKSFTEYEKLLHWVLESGGDRRSVIFAVGGGVIGDLAGFVAASFARGIRFVQVPTTLLAMVDSSVGGKTGINLPAAKNMVGAFWQPTTVLVGTEVMSSLPDRSYLSGLAEVVKYGVIDDAVFFEWLENNCGALVARDPDAMSHAITESCRSKSRVVVADERETSGRRAILNYGHTFAHAIEATCGYGTLLHGEAVSIGMQMAARLAIDLGLCDQSLLTRQTALIEGCRLPVTLESADPEAMLPAMMKDKKVAHGKLRFVLPTEIGKVELVGDVDEEAVRSAIQRTRS